MGTLRFDTLENAWAACPGYDGDDENAWAAALRYENRLFKESLTLRAACSERGKLIFTMRKYGGLNT